MPVQLAGVPLEHLTAIVTTERARLARHPVPGMTGDLLQDLGRPSVEVRISGVFLGPAAAEDLRAFRQAQASGGPVDLVVQAVDDTDPVQTLGFAQVVIAALDVTQRAGSPGQFEFTCLLVEYVEPPKPAAPDLLAGIDTGLASEAASFVDGAGDALAQVAGVAQLATGTFADPTTRLQGMLTTYAPVATGGVSLLDGISDLFTAED